MADWTCCSVIGEGAPRHLGRRRGSLELLHRFQENRIVKLVRAAEFNRKIERGQDQDTDALDRTDRLDIVNRRFCLDQDVADDRATDFW